MADEPQPETPLGDLLPSYVIRVLAKNDIHTIEGVQRAYPHDLLTMWGMGVLRFKQIETTLFPGKSHNLPQAYPSTRHINGSALNGVLSPGTVRALARAGITTVEELRAMDPKQLMRIDGFGEVKLREIERVFLMGQRLQPKPVMKIRPAPPQTGDRVKGSSNAG